MESLPYLKALESDKTPDPAPDMHTRLKGVYVAIQGLEDAIAQMSDTVVELRCELMKLKGEK